MTRKILLILLSTLLGTLPSGAESGPEFRYRMDNISLNRGLAQHDVSSIIQDRYGFIWIATYNGLHRYDGYEFRIFKHRYDDPGSISDNRILFIAEDSHSRLIVATEGGGLNLYDHDTEQFTTFHFGDNPVDNNLYYILEDPARGLWVASSNGLYRVHINENNEFSYVRYASPPDVRSIALLPSGDLFVGTTLGACILGDADDPHGGYRTLDCIPRGMVYNIVDAGEGGVFICSDTGLYLYGTDGECRRLDFPQFDSGVRGMLRLDGDRLLVAAARNGIAILTMEDGVWKLAPLGVENEGALSRSVSKTMFIDGMNNLWIGTGMNGVFRIDLSADRFYRLFTAQGDGQSFVRAFLHDSHGRQWVQTRHSPLRMERDGVLSPVEIDIPAGEDNLVTGITEDIGRNIWLCAGRQLFEVTAGGDPLRPRNIAADPVFGRDIAPRLKTLLSVASDDRGTVWVGAWNGLLRVKPGALSDRYMFYDDFEFHNADVGIVGIFCDRAGGKLWACSRNYGLIMFELDEDDNITGHTLLSLHGPPGKQLSSNHVWSVIRADDGVVWVGTDTGLNSIELQGSEVVVRRDGLPERLMSEKILGIRQDNDGDLWLNTSDGLLRYTPSDGNLREYYARDGLSSSGLTEGIVRGADGTMYVSTINGVTAFDPRRIKPNPYAPLVRLTGLRIFNRDVAVGEKVGGRVILDRSLLRTESIRLRYDQNNFTILFVGIHFRNSVRNMYSWKLEGYDREWVTGSRRDFSATYNSLPPGRYLFRVKAANSDGVWSEHEATLGVEIGVAPWLSWWAYALYAALLLAVIFVIMKYYSRQQELRNNLYIEQLQNKHERQMSEAREKFHANITHELRTPLTLISAPLQELAGRLGDDSWVASRFEFIQNNTRRLLQLVNQFLDLNKIDSDNMRLNVAQTDVGLLARQAVEDFRPLARTKNINLYEVSEFSPAVGLFDRDKVTKILFNLISNAVKFTPEGGSIAVILSPQEDILQIEVEDTGCGISAEELPKIFDRFYQNPTTSASGTGIGLALARKLAELHHGDIKAYSRLGEGSRFVVSLPLNPAVYSSREIGTAPPLPSPQSETTQGEARPTVLLVEDDDDLRSYIAQSLGGQFDVLARDNAVAGRETALRYMPDLIITDVMMAGVNGLELCEQLKSDFRTSHIPIIILTARSEPEDITLGLRTGAENYITKPFDSEQLLLKVTNIITYSRRRAMAASPDDAQGASSLNEREQKFMDKLKGLIIEKMEDVDYGIEEICLDLGVSRMQLHRKLTMLVNKTTSEYIRDVKMACAREFMESGMYNVSETVYKVGFKSNSHFSKTFKAIYGITPSEFARKKH